jgi:hypothetical protein
MKQIICIVKGVNPNDSDDAIMSKLIGMQQ